MVGLPVGTSLQDALVRVPSAGTPNPRQRRPQADPGDAGLLLHGCQRMRVCEVASWARRRTATESVAKSIERRLRMSWNIDSV